MAIEKIIYTPEGQFVAGQRGYFLKLRAMVSEAIGARELIWRLFLRDFRVLWCQSGAVNRFSSSLGPSCSRLPRLEYSWP